MRYFLCLLALATPAFAFEHTVEYRFTGSELVSFQVKEAMNEDPALLTLELMTENMGPQTVEIESDMGFDECAELLTAAQGDSSSSMTLVADLSGQTLNGVELLYCVRR